MLGLLGLVGNFLSGGFLGLLTSIVPAVLHLLQSRQDNAHELAMRELDIRAAAAAADQQLRQIDTTGQWQEVVNLIQAQARPSGVKWIDALSAFIRPFLTLYWCVGVFSAVKAAQMWVLIHDTPWQDVAHVLLTVWWGDFEQQIIGAIIMYWFGARGFAKWRAGRA